MKNKATCFSFWAALSITHICFSVWAALSIRHPSASLFELLFYSKSICSSFWASASITHPSGSLFKLLYQKHIHLVLWLLVRNYTSVGNLLEVSYPPAARVSGLIPDSLNFPVFSFYSSYIYVTVWLLSYHLRSTVTGVHGHDPCSLDKNKKYIFLIQLVTTSCSVLTTRNTFADFFFTVDNEPVFSMWKTKLYFCTL
jgi:hypothetical protein